MATSSKWWMSVVSFVFFGVISCTPWEATYLEKAVNHATSAEVTDRLGPPHAKKALAAGGSEWTYQYRGSAVGPMGGINTGSASCREYVLTFDQKDVLRGWKRQQC